MKSRNDIPLLNPLGGESHFRLREFENAEGLVMVHPSTLLSLERTRAYLCRRFGEEVIIVITEGVRTQADLERLAARLGWTDEGGLVSRNSMHLASNEGTGVDIKAMIKRTKEPIPQAVLADAARKHFDYVKGDYKDGHVHSDNRNQKGV